MTGSDDAILTLLGKTGLALPPRAIAKNLDDVSYRTVERRLPQLESAGLVERHETPRGYREITPLGERYLAGDVSEEEVQAIAESGG